MTDLRIGRSRLPELLVKAGKRQSQLADYLNVSESYVSQVISGKTRFSIINMKRTADFLGCHMDDLNEWIYF